MSLTLYRAMCQVERDLTLYHQSLQFHRNREKCFSPNIAWIKTNPMNGKFNNSQWVQGRYAHLLEFEFTDYSLPAFRQCRNEWKTDIRSMRLVNIIAIKDVKTSGN
ncbi:hypothetical protein 2AV2_89 [Nodularia phage vB_NpeS-2AV2]|jgi:hypothetical protein|uniref:Uncharacterized protein n=3 Tax=Ravarandavirus TaxID=2843444 RepID=A0A482MLK8_9CAUD|nr:hypothetical protein HWA92_gp089 [Nodularia phage vB_NpeS-2AV2]YP_009844916.1 hypothetical protein HWC13_gp107 [Nodularia phage vB_NspS-kac68v161]ALY07541.1 hypothetical protein 2AV2_89 [Nodularia phage vB_NpeS-2AV2]QBQ73757.1 hypothetical protein kac68v161_gp107 [Nodularia phage vB_NspS-kac68v161]QBQ73953.1 hypothetical protein kac68v162_gp105 [Nodularia phage vB_NspS-kac68v162]